MPLLEWHLRRSHHFDAGCRPCGRLPRRLVRHRRWLRRGASASHGLVTLRGEPRAFPRHRWSPDARCHWDIPRHLAEKYRVTKEQVLIASGSVESLAATALAWGRQGSILCPDLFWDATARYAEMQGATLKRVRLDANMRVNLATLESALDDSITLIHLCNPNNPTGLLLDPDELRAFRRRVSPRVTILIDEAYNELTDEPERNSMMDLAHDGQNVIISRTFSKIYGMAGMRVGYVVSTPDNIERIWQHQMCWVAAPSVAAAIDANVFQSKMKEKGVLIQGVYRDYQRWSRVSMGHLQDVGRYVKALPEVLAS